MELNLRKKSDASLVMDLKGLVARERDTLTRILHYLKEVDSRKIYLARSYPTLFAWMLGELGYSEAAASRRIAAMRLIQEVPEIEQDLQSGAMSLSVASQVQTYFRKEAKQRKEAHEAPLAQEAKRNLLFSLKGTSARECEKKLIKICPEINLPKDKARPITEEKYLIQFKADQALMKKIELLQQLLSHQAPGNEYGPILEKAVDLALDKLDPIRRQARREKMRAKTSVPTSEIAQKPQQTPRTKPKPRSRHIPAPLRDYIWQRDQGRCQFQDPKTGRQCSNNKALQLDHRYPFALGGENTKENLRLMCGGHNRYRAQKVFGPTSRVISDVGNKK